MILRRLFRQTQSLEELERLREEAKRLPPGARREKVLRKVRQAEMAVLEEWVRSTGRPEDASPEASAQPMMEFTKP
jgi:hypothetical protein